jgi:hypothetical protein
MTWIEDAHLSLHGFSDALDPRLPAVVPAVDRFRQLPLIKLLDYRVRYFGKVVF